MQGKPVVSIIVAVYNGRRTLGRCIESVLSQDYENRELIIIDGGSTDGSRSEIERFADSLSFWCSEPDTGIYNAWNKGLSRAKGEWICFIGADDYYSRPDAISKLIAQGREDDDFVFAKVEIVDSDGKTRRAHGKAWRWEALKKYQSVAHPGALHSRALLAKLGGFREQFKIAGDYDAFLRAGRNARATFLDLEIIKFSNGGVSSSKEVALARELWHIQSAHPEIGPYRASFNYLDGLMRRRARRALGRE